MAKDAKKLEILKRNYETASENVKTLKARAGSRPGAARLSEIQRAEQSLLDRFHELDQWDDVMKRSAQKILDAEETTLIDKRSIARQRISVGITTIGVLVIGLFGDRIFLKIQEWLESDDPREQEKDVLAFLQDWNKGHPRVIEASLLPWFSRREVNPLEKSVVFFMNSRQLGVRTGVLERALARYKRLDPHGYAQLQGTAEAELIKSLKKRVANEGRQLELLIEERKNAPPSNGYYRVYRAEVDNTYVAKPILKW